MYRYFSRFLDRFLAWVETRTGIDTHYFTKGGFWIIVSGAVSSLTSFILTLGFTNLLSPEVYGTYRYVLSIFSIFVIASLSSMKTSVINAVSRGYEGILRSVLRRKILWGLLGSLASLGVAAYYYFVDYNASLAIAFLIAAVFVPLFESFGIYDAFLQGKKFFQKFSQYSVVSNLIATSFVFVVLFFTRDIIFVLSAYFFSWFFVRFIFFHITVRKFRPNSRNFPGALTYGTHLSLVFAIGSIATSFDDFLLFHYLGPVELAFYAVANFFPIQARGLTGSLVNLFLPKLSPQDPAQIHKQFPVLIRRLFFVGVLGTVIYILLLPFLFRVFFPQYVDAILYAYLLAPLIIFFFVRLGYDPVLFSQFDKKPKKYIYFLGLPHIFVIFASFIFVSIFGLLGVIFSRFLFQIIFLFIEYFVWRRIRSSVSIAS